MAATQNSDGLYPSGRNITFASNSAHTQLASVLARAFEHDPLFTYTFPHAPSRRHLHQQFFRPGLRYAQRYGLIQTTSDLAGCALWLKPAHHEMTAWGLLRSGMFFLPLRIGFAPFRRFITFVNFAEAIHKQAIDRPHWYLFVLGVDPGLQGQGIGSALIQPMLAKADEQQVPCYLETNGENNVRFYSHHGFEIVHNATVVKDGPPLWTMVRSPS